MNVILEWNLFVCRGLTVSYIFASISEEVSNCGFDWNFPIN